jgi:hypothetical protein
MDTRVRFVTIMIVFAVTGWWTPSESIGQLPSAFSIDRPPAHGISVGDSPGIVFHGPTETQAERMAWAIGRYEALDLELPSLDIYFAGNCQEKFGAWGRFQHESGTPWRIDVCTTAVYLHELAHAWDRWNLTDAERRTYLGLRGLESWQGNDIPWDERGIEDLAILVARVVGQGVDNYRSEDRLSDLSDFSQMTGVAVPDGERAEMIDPQDESPQY